MVHAPISLNRRWSLLAMCHGTPQFHQHSLVHTYSFGLRATADLIPQAFEVAHVKRESGNVLYDSIWSDHRGSRLLINCWFLVPFAVKEKRVGPAGRIAIGYIIEGLH